MEFALGPVAQRSGYRLAAFATIGSTNAEALEQVRRGGEGPLWFVTEHQTAGHGRRGRPWQAPRGNLAASLLIPCRAGASHAAGLGFVAGLALNAALARIAPHLEVSTALDAAGGGGTSFLLKWPNDVLAGGGKIAGVLVELERSPSGMQCAVVGIGLNVAEAPVDVPYAVTSMAALGCRVDAAKVFAALSDAWVQFHAVWDEGRGMAEIRRLWLREAAGLGAPVAVQLGGDVIRGTFETLDDEGRLVVLTEAGARRTIAAGEVHFGAAATLR
jgi:BirA family transcriptional regulator, biotin operon repressor / biotin---[acetyl-CoA-carboxylase] ligase